MLLILLIASALAETITEIINSNPSSTWVAIDYPQSVMDKLRFRQTQSTILPRRTINSYRLNDVPDEFDSRTRWPDMISGVRDQGKCGASEAFSVADVIGDRLGVLGCPLGQLSPEDIVSCSQKDGCGGQFVDKVWNYAKKTGIATEECIPYEA
ncbi:MAG: putative cathepsin B2 cysteine protease [Streblomastix strix]|uniref:Putative cathepsin B2 cysteine protease n=1 Tax=Streblomastix strix TaxID=222440 RepID=A0A5J4VZE3_9EUKA|nr:MAG: putative cathepsin B2 cysteine protease [Streblomastix strix]